MVHPDASPLPTPDFVSPENEVWAFARMRCRILWTLLRQMLSESRFRVALVVTLTTSLWIGMFTMFFYGFRELQGAISQPELQARMIGAVFGTFFAALMLMLIFSSAIILYSSLFCSKEAAFLLTIPARTEQVFLHKFQESLLLSSWGFVLLGSPILLAYGVVENAPWYFYVMLMPYLVAFVYIPVAIGAIICLLIVYRIPDSRLGILIGGGIVLLVGAGWAAWLLLSSARSDMLTAGWFLDLLGRLQFSEQYLLPSWWLSAGLLSAVANSKDTLQDSILFLGLMISNALVFRLLALWMASRIYRVSYSNLFGRSLRRRRSRPARFDRMVSRMLSFLPDSVRLMNLKDLRVFRRDPVQWSQFLIFLSLLALYFFNVRRFTHRRDFASWLNMMSFLNLSVVGLLLSTFTTRFIFPMVSLEGRRFWILGLLPMRREMILWSKFFFAAGGSIIPFTLLVLLSDIMLDVSKMIMISHQLTCLILCFGLSGIAVGFGARFPNLREQSPSRIAAGFGGTLTLVVSTLYILAVVLLTALPIHFYVVPLDTGMVSTSGAGQTPSLPWWMLVWLILGTLASLLLGTIATFLPMWIGLRTFQKAEF